MTKPPHHNPDRFTIIQSIASAADWDHHDAHLQENKLAQLSANADKADERQLALSAERFQPSDALLDALNAALAARVPLLLTGEPGTGKTQVAWFIKRYFGIPLHQYQVHSNSQASDMRYDFDAVAYLRDAYLARTDDDSDNDATHADENTQHDTDPRSAPRYLKKKALWQAYDHTGESVLLIDEIDKAPRDFPNDLLQELDQHEFAHPFEDRAIKRNGTPPIVIITSNGERRLPDAFLRRCMVHHIRLDKALLRSIMQAWESQFPELSSDTRDKALERFEELRGLNLSKKPGAAELLLWLTVLSARGIDADKLDCERADLPDLACLIKDPADHKLL